ncbi:MAG: DNA-protecting protein DprA [Candidatus Rokubacteria bacterium]|nr:DNA-protecting protein DprA [Candidatus Rokubacteria bacterium]
MAMAEERDRWIPVAAAIAPTRQHWDSAVAEQRSRAERIGARLVLLGDPEYPAQLKTIPSPPPFLFVRGEILAEDALAVALVGARRGTRYGLQVAQQLAADLAARGVTVISGFARGVDTAAHVGALGAGGRTIAVLGSGVDVIYPPENRRLLARVIERGAIVSQFPMGARALGEHFPFRNRTIAGLALGTVVVEAAERSGALITAGHAGELGREVFAVPGNITSEMSRGTNRLIQDGAKLVESWEDVAVELPEAWRQRLVTPEPRAPAGPSLEGDEGRLLALIGQGPVHAAELIERSRIPSGRAAALLVTLELQGWIRQLPGKLYVRAKLS